MMIKKNKALLSTRPLDFEEIERREVIRIFTIIGACVYSESEGSEMIVDLSKLVGCVGDGSLPTIASGVHSEAMRLFLGGGDWDPTFFPYVQQGFQSMGETLLNELGSDFVDWLLFDFCDLQVSSFEDNFFKYRDFELSPYVSRLSDDMKQFINQNRARPKPECPAWVVEYGGLDKIKSYRANFYCTK